MKNAFAFWNMLEINNLITLNVMFLKINLKWAIGEHLIGSYATLKIGQMATENSALS